MYGITRLFSSTSYIPFNRYVARAIGRAETILLGELCSKHDYWKERNNIVSVDGKEYFFETREDIEYNTTLTPYEQRKATDKLLELGIIEMKKIGLPAKNYYTINEEQLLKIFDISSKNSSQLEVKEFHTTKNTYTKNTILNNNSHLKDDYEEEEDTIKEKKKIDICPYNDIINLYHSILPSNPKVRELPDYRKAKIRNLWKTKLTELENWRKYFVFISHSDFLTGRSSKCNNVKIFNLEWFTTLKHFTDIMECKYHDGGKR